MNLNPQLLAGLIGAIIAAITSVCAVMLTGLNQRKLEAARWKREDQARFHMYRRELYARFLSNVSTAFQSCSVVVGHQGDPIAEEIPIFQEQKKLLLDSMATLTTLWEEISLIASQPVIQLAKEINRDVGICRLATYLPNGKAMIEDAQKKYLEALRPRFLEEARQELGIILPDRGNGEHA